MERTRRPSLLMVDDDATFRKVLGDSLSRRGFDVVSAASVADALVRLQGWSPDFAVVDLRMPGESGLELLNHLGASVRTVVLTGFASIATAVQAVKQGAVHYLTKPADTDEIVAALTGSDAGKAVPVPDRPMSIERLEWEHLQKAVVACGGNISAAARRLGMHRRTLQRKLAKRPVRR